MVIVCLKKYIMRRHLDKNQNGRHRQRYLELVNLYYLITEPAASVMQHKL